MKNVSLLIFLFTGLANCTEKQPDISYLKNAENDTIIESGIFSLTSATTIYMEKRNEVFILPVIINGTNMDMVFDTGASDVSISETEADFLLKQGTLSVDHILGENRFMDATGKISVGTTILLKEVSIAGKVVRDVQATVVSNNQAPLLLGLTALEKFGKIIFDPTEGTLTFE